MKNCGLGNSDNGNNFVTERSLMRCECLLLEMAIAMGFDVIHSPASGMNRVMIAACMIYQKFYMQHLAYAALFFISGFRHMFAFAPLVAEKEPLQSVIA